LTQHPDNRVPFRQPEGYDPKQYELLARIYEAGWDATFRKFDPIPNLKTDTNNHGPMSTDNIGFNYDYPEASYERRREIIREHETYQKGWLYFHVSDPRVPEKIREEMQRWGLAADEFVDNGHWPHQIYVREARRMKGKFVMTENELQKRRRTPKPIGMGSYTIDSHNVQRYITPEGHVQNEGDIGVSTYGPYQIAYESLVPHEHDCQNLLVPVCVSSSHIAFGSIRMEPVFMILGQSAATAAVLAIDRDRPVQHVDYDRLRARLLADGQVLEFSGGASRRAWGLDQFSGTLIDNTAAELRGRWQTSQANTPHFVSGYLHDGNSDKGRSQVTYQQAVETGHYELQLAYPPNANRATNVPVEILHAAGTTRLRVHQTQTPAIEGVFHSLGTFRFGPDHPVTVVIGNDDTEGYVVVDVLRLLPAEAPPDAP
jgi:hypothetical protein